MHFIRSIAVAAAILSVPSVVFFASAADPAPAEGASEVATFVDNIHTLVTEETKQYKYLVKLMKDKKYWDGLLKELHTLDWEGTKALVAEVRKILTPATGGTIVEGGDYNDTAARPFKTELAKLVAVDPDTVFADANTAATTFKPKEFVENVSKTLVEYSKAIALATPAGIFTTKPAVSELAGPLAKCFTKLKADQFKDAKKQLYDDLMKTVNENKDYEDSNLIWYILGGVLLLAIVAGIVIYVVLQRRNK